MRFLLALAVAACLVSPGVLLLAFPTGPGPGRTGAPGESGTCTGGSCHFGASVRNEGIFIYFPGGMNYRPGAAQRIQLQVTGVPAEPETAHYGFQLSARLQGEDSAEAPGGTFRAIDPNTWVQCQDGGTPDGGTCAAGQEIQYVQHRSPARIPVWDIEWTPPADATGPIRFYVAVNAANGKLDQAGDRIYQASILVQPVGSIRASNLLGGGGTLSALSWIRLETDGLLERAREVTIGNSPVSHPIFAAPGQILAEVPMEVAEGPQVVKVGEQEHTITFSKASPVIAGDQFAAGLSMGREARILVHGCGATAAEPGTAFVWIANHRAPATVEPVPDWPGSCTLLFTTPQVREQEHLIRACLHGACSPGRTLVRLTEPPPD